MFRSKVVCSLCLLLAGLGIVAVVPHIAHAATRCEACKGTGKDICEFCGGRGCAQCNWKGVLYDCILDFCVPAKCEYCGGTGVIYTPAEKEEMRKAKAKEEKERAEYVAKQNELERLRVQAARASIGTFTDSRDGKRYKKITIGAKTWMAENLNYNAYTSKCYENIEEYCLGYGRLYNWETALVACPAGFHLPTDAEWTALTNYVGGGSRNLKSTSGWYKDYDIFSKTDGNGTNTFEFSALPGGSGRSDGRFLEAGNGYWWSATEYDASHAYRRLMSYSDNYVDRDSKNKTNLYSVRCVEGVDEEQERMKQKAQRNEQERERQEKERARQEEARKQAEERTMTIERYINYGIDSHTKGNFDDAIKWYNKALQLNPNLNIQEYIEMAKKKKKLKNVKQKRERLNDVGNEIEKRERLNDVDNEIERLRKEL
jgi:uncharacterized protein (TIGR02145 family)